MAYGSAAFPLSWCIRLCLRQSAHPVAHRRFAGTAAVNRLARKGLALGAAKQLLFPRRLARNGLVRAAAKMPLLPRRLARNVLVLAAAPQPPFLPVPACSQAAHLQDNILRVAAAHPHAAKHLV